MGIGICLACGWATSFSVSGCPRCCTGEVLSAGEVYGLLQEAKKERNDAVLRVGVLEGIVVKYEGKREDFTLKERKVVLDLVEEHVVTTRFQG